MIDISKHTMEALVGVGSLQEMQGSWGWSTGWEGIILSSKVRVCLTEKAQGRHEKIRIWSTSYGETITLHRLNLASIALNIRLPIFVMRQLQDTVQQKLNEYSMRYSVAIDDIFRSRRVESEYGCKQTIIRGYMWRKWAADDGIWSCVGFFKDAYNC